MVVAAEAAGPADEEERHDEVLGPQHGQPATPLPAAVPGEAGEAEEGQALAERLAELLPAVTVHVVHLKRDAFVSRERERERKKGRCVGRKRENAGWW